MPISPIINQIFIYNYIDRGGRRRGEITVPCGVWVRGRGACAVKCGGVRPQSRLTLMLFMGRDDSTFCWTLLGVVRMTILNVLIRGFKPPLGLFSATSTL